MLAPPCGHRAQDRRRSSLLFSQNPPRLSGGSQNQNKALNTRRGPPSSISLGSMRCFPKFHTDTRFLPTESPWTLPQSTVPPGRNNWFPGPRWTPQETQCPQSPEMGPRPPESLSLACSCRCLELEDLCTWESIQCISGQGVGSRSGKSPQ